MIYLEPPKAELPVHEEPKYSSGSFSAFINSICVDLMSEMIHEPVRSDLIWR